MDLPNLKELRAVLKLCRSQGVSKITLAEIIVEFGDMPTVIKGGERVVVEEDEDSASFPTDEQLAYWSAAPDPLASREEGGVGGEQ